ncbi:uncharacterized protein [Aristolochia californica]|uniref:uncharacterized protein isoform X2 n=1 Tax=Aristolochia californica TaxID=171875 RepID=UPI0035E08D34
MQSSVVEDQEMKDQRSNSSMEDSAAMTIEFLRARLLSERSVSRTAKQRADQLAKRIVTSQRKKAGKAAAEVLAILENHGISDFSEAFDSNSDHDGFDGESKSSDNSVKEEKNCMNSKLRKDEVEDGLSSSGLEASPTTGRSLSRKSGSNNQSYYEKKTFSQPRRRQSGFLSTSGSSSKQQLGRSCRQIKQRETREAQEDVRDVSKNGLAMGMDEISNHFEGKPETSNEASPNEEEKAFLDNIDAYSPADLRVQSGSSLHENGEKDAEMEKVLEQQAQLIVRYQAQENAQREREEKYREDNGCLVDLCEPGKQSDVTEERNTPKTGSAEHVDTIAPFQEELKPNKNEVQGSAGAVDPRNLSFTPSSPIVHDLDSIHTSSFTQFGTGCQDLAPQGSQDKLGVQMQKQDWSVGNSSKGVGHCASKFQPLSSGTPENSARGLDISNQSFSKEESSGDQKSHLSVVNQTPNRLDGVLETLQLAKSSLHQKLFRFPLSRNAIITLSTTPHNQVLAMDDKTHAPIEIPVGCAPQFRLPTELPHGASSHTNFQRRHSDLALSLTGGFPEHGRR